ncbi:ExbD/TolR family protein [Treponema primitia]|uniref:ExbD/TolR family protein n=1 Tax=Treponema primitia TaxID=88058 RepID=UPI0002555598|nr:biopolymer transporter ExbD [Treponema primitia]
MKLHRRTKRGFDDTSASSDVAFLLIIYFIVIAGFNVNKGFLMNLPAKDSTRLILKDDLLRFDLDGTGTLLHQGAALNYASAEREIRGAVAAHPNLAVILTVDGRAPWQTVVSFVEMAQKLNVESFSFTMKKNDGGPP